MRIAKYRDSGLVIPVHTDVAGRYKLRVYRPDGQCRHDTGWFDNLITDGGLDMLGSGGYLSQVSVGSGSTTPVVTDTALASFVASTTNVTGTVESAQGSAPYYGSTIWTWRFAAGAAQGNLSEVGVGLSGGNLFSRSLITDGNGNPTTITVLADEFLDVTYELQCIPPTSDSSFNIVDSGPAGTTHVVVLRASSATDARPTAGWTTRNSAISLEHGTALGDKALVAYDGTLGTIAASPSGNKWATDSGSNRAYVPQSLEKVADFTFQLDDANFTSGITAVRFSFENLGGTWQMSFDPAIPKTDTDTLTFTVKTSWTRTTAL